MNSKEIRDDKSLSNLNLSYLTKVLLKKLKLTMLISILVIWFLYTLIDCYVHHKRDLHQTVFTLNFHEFWNYFIILLLFTFIYIFSYSLIKKQDFLDNLITESEENELFIPISFGLYLLNENFFFKK